MFSFSESENLQAGDVDAALDEVKARVRKAPGDPRQRTLLFQLLAVKAQWDRARTALDVLGGLEKSSEQMVASYRVVLQCEALRSRIFAGATTPEILGEPQQWMADLFEALRMTALGEHAAASTLREQAFDAAPATRGTIDGQAFEWIADADARVGPMIEAIVGARYLWIPFSRVRDIHMPAPKELHNLVWAPAAITLANDSSLAALIPTRYPGVESSSDGMIQLARTTEWSEPAPNSYIGAGQRLWATDQGDHPVLDIRAITLEVEKEDGPVAVEPAPPTDSTP